jgi:alpha-2-macroglobulin
MSKFFTLLWLLAPMTLQAQTSLPNSLHTSAQQYIYRITDAEAQAIFTKGIRPAKTEQYLHTLIDSTNINAALPHLPVGHYLLAYAQENNLHIKLHDMTNSEIKIINNYRSLAVLVHDSTGQTITDAHVKLRNKTLAFDANTQCYRLGRYRKKGLLQVEYNGMVSYHPLTNSLNNRRTLWQKIKWSFPLKYVSHWLRRKKPYRRRYDYFNGTVPYQQQFDAYMVFSKPRYKPGDTVRFKAYILPKKGKAINRPLLLRLTDDRFDTDTIVAIVQPYRSGGYEGQLVLNDSLDLDLDDDYLLSLEELGSRRYDLNEYDGDLEDEEYAMKRKILAKAKFYFEAYELDQVHFKARTDKSSHGAGQKVAVLAKATDENDLPIGDGRLQLTVLRNSVTAVYVPQLYIPDTIWQHSQPLDPVGETKVSLPDSIFSQADFGYTIVAKFLNSNNEEQVERLEQQYRFARNRILFTPVLDSLRISYEYQGQQRPAKALVSLQGSGTHLQQGLLKLPATIKLNPFMEQCSVKTDSLQANYTVPGRSAGVDFYTNRSKDSIFINTNNPKQLFFWYTLMADNRILQQGYTQNLNIGQKTITRKNYFLLLQYVWAGKMQKADYFIPYHNKTLSIAVDQPAQVYPGQQVPIEVLVKDAEGRPVADADVTGWSFTQKFEKAAAPQLPFTSKTYPGFTKKINYVANNPLAPEAAIALNWQRWSREMGLDSIAYFQFLHPGPIYQSTVPVADSLTQLAPFVVKAGNLQPIHLLYIDERPVFFSQAEQQQYYSFALKPGKHALRMRTHNSMVQLDSIWIKAGVKNFISVEAGATGINTRPMPDTLTPYEQELWTRYMIVVQNKYGEDFATVEQGDKLYLLPQLKPYQPNSYLYNSPYDVLVGPLPNNNANLSVKRQFEQPFTAEPSYSFTIDKGLIKQKSLPGKYPFRSRLNYTPTVPDFKKNVLTQDAVDSLWQEYLDQRANQEYLYSNWDRSYSNSPLEISVGKGLDEKPVFVKSIFLFRYDNPDVVHIFRGSQRQLGRIPAGLYKMMLLLKAGRYAIYDSISVRDDGYNYYATGIVQPRRQDSMSHQMNTIVDSWRKDSYYQNAYADGNRLKEVFNEQQFNRQALTQTISGRVTDTKGVGIASAVVTIKGLNKGVVTDANGYFTLQTTKNGTLLISSVGYSTQEWPIANAFAHIELPAQTGLLSEVVVTGYGTVKKRELSFSVAQVSANNLLQGKVAGLQINSGQPGQTTNIILRGITSTNEGKAPLYVVDGVLYEGNLADLDMTAIVSVEVLKDAAATALYGAAGANGVIILTTNKGGRMRLDSMAATTTETANALPNSLRRNFRDDGFWQPRLRTNSQGKARFTVTFPDDITKWRSFYAAMTDKRQTGITELAIRSFKPLSANLALPQFLVQGDSINIIGKVLNYNSDTATVNRNLYINGSLSKQQSIQVANARIDTIGLSIHGTDSMKIKYTIEQANGYFDGEERSIPVFTQGVQETQGLFAVLDSDTSFTLPQFDKLATLTLHAEASVLPVLLDEIDKVKKYEYLCNEQLASKLKCLLLEKKIRQQLNQPFAEDKNIKTIIEKLTQNRGRNFMWGWWANNDPSLWISLHVTEALLQAEAMGYTVGLAKQPIIDYIVYNQESFYREDKIRSLLLLQQLQAKADFKRYADSIAAHFTPNSLYQKLQWIAAQQQLGLPVNVDSVPLWSSRTGAKRVTAFLTMLYKTRCWPIPSCAGRAVRKPC